MKNNRSATVGSGLLDWIVWERFLATFLPLTSCQRKYSSWASVKKGKISSKRDMLTLVSARNVVGFFRAFV